jgi:hypothetical protein
MTTQAASPVAEAAKERLESIITNEAKASEEARLIAERQAEVKQREENAQAKINAKWAEIEKQYGDNPDVGNGELDTEEKTSPAASAPEVVPPPASAAQPPKAPVAAKQNSGASAPSAAPQGKVVQSGDSLPDELLYDAQLAGLSQDEVAFYGNDVSALQKRVAFALRRQPPQGAAPTAPVVEPPKQQQQTQQPAKPAAVAPPAASPAPVQAQEEIPKPEGFEEWESSVQKAWMNREKAHRAEIGEIRAEVAGIKDHLAVDQQQRVIEAQANAQQWLHTKFESDTANAAHLDQVTRTEIQADMRFLTQRAIDSGAAQMPWDKLYEKARTRVFAEKGILETQIRAVHQQAYDKRRGIATIPPPGKTLESQRTTERLTDAQIGTKMSRKYGHYFEQ